MKPNTGLGVTLLVTTIAALAEARPESHRCGAGQGSRPLEVVGLTDDQRLICFSEYRPKKAWDIGAISGLQGDDMRLVGIDFRPATGELYGVGNAGGVYTLDLGNAAATFRSRLNVSLMGESFGVDFNPTVDRLRITSDAGQNLRVDVTTGATTVDTNLTFGVAGSAYTNNDADTNTATTLFDLDSNLDQVVIQAPPNAGSLNPTGKLAVDAGARVGFDIYTVMHRGQALGARAFAALSVDGSSQFYAISLLTGRAFSRGAFASSNMVVGIAIPLAQP